MWKSNVQVYSGKLKFGKLSMLPAEQRPAGAEKSVLKEVSSHNPHPPDGVLETNCSLPLISDHQILMYVTFLPCSV